jgi:hypothetical protein
MKAYVVAFGTHWTEFWQHPDTEKARATIRAVNDRERAIVAVLKDTKNAITIPAGLPPEVDKILRLGIAYQVSITQEHERFLEVERRWLDHGTHDTAQQLFVAAESFLQKTKEYQEGVEREVQALKQTDAQLRALLSHPETLQRLRDLPPTVLNNLQEYFSRKNFAYNLQFLFNLVTVFLLSDKHIIMPLDNATVGLLQGDFSFPAMLLRFVAVGIVTNMAGLPSIMGQIQNSWIARLEDSLEGIRSASRKAMH